MQRRIGRQAMLAAVLAFLTPCAVDAIEAATTEATTLHGRTMGTTYNIRYWRSTEGGPSAPEQQRSIDARLANVDLQMSTWRQDSELSRFNAGPSGEWFPVSADTAIVIGRALELHRLTDGASDVTVAPLSRLWGFGPQAGQQARLAAPPSGEQIADALKRVGANRLQARLDPPALRKDIAELEVDLSSIAPGYAVDLIVDKLTAVGVENVMVELGGEIRALGVRPDGAPWRIGVESPTEAGPQIARAVPLANLGLATSGDFHNVREIGGVRYTHIIDPRTGRALRYRGASVTVLAETCFAADGLATAVFVMGPDDGYQWCVDNDVAALFLTRDGETGGVTERATPRFEKLTAPTHETRPTASTETP
jgi:FAD:protein FMN transferase